MKYIFYMKRVFLAALVVLLSNNLWADSVDVDLTALNGETKDYHKVMTQVYKWYLLYENSEYPLSNQLDILDENIKIQRKNPDGSDKVSYGHEAYINAVEDLPYFWRNAHHIQKVKISKTLMGSLVADFEIIYQNLGMKEKKDLSVYKIVYRAVLDDVKGSTLPKFTEISLEPQYGSVVEDDNYVEGFEPAYYHNRAMSLAHYWLYLFERDDKSPEPFKELLSKKGFKLYFSSTQKGNPIDSFAEFEQWFQGNASDEVIQSSNHKIENIEIKRRGKNKYRIEMELSWEGVSAKTKESLELRTFHTWSVEDRSYERFPRIKEVKVKLLNDE